MIAQSPDSAYHQNKWDRFSVSFGGFLASYNSDIKVANDQVGLGITIDIEDVLGITSNTFAFRGNASYRFGKRQRNTLSAGYFGIFRSSKKTLERELEIGDEVFPVGTELAVKFNFTIIRAKYDYTFFEDDRVSLGTSFGLFIVPFSLAINTTSFNDHQTKFTAPLPLLGLRSDFRISQKFSLYQSVELLYLTFGNYQGSILDLNMLLEYKAFSNVAFGAGLNSNRLKVNIESENTKIDFFGTMRMEYTGLMLYAKYYINR